MFDHVHAEIQSNSMRLGEHITGISDANVNWRNFAVRDKRETKMSKG